jgi:hypothetical protein
MAPLDVRDATLGDEASDVSHVDPEVRGQARTASAETLSCGTTRCSARRQPSSTKSKRLMQDFLLHVRTRTRSRILMVTHDVADQITVPFGDVRGPHIQRDPRFLDLRDEIEDLLHAPSAA